MFANAGIGEYRSLPEMTEAHLDAILDVNVKGTVYTVQKAIPLLRDGASVLRGRRQGQV